MSTKYSGTLESSRADGKLAFTKDIFDNTNQKSQEQINADIKKVVTDNKKILDDEIIRAGEAESTLTDSISTEKRRATGVEQNLANAISDEVRRAMEAEDLLGNKEVEDFHDVTESIANLTTTVNDNKTKSDTDASKNATAIVNESNRAVKSELNIQKQIDNITVDPVTYEEVVARGLNDLYDITEDIGIQTPIMKKLLHWFDVKDINYYDNDWYSRVSTNKINLGDLNSFNKPKENDITFLENVLYNFANKQLISNDESNYKTTSVLIGINYESAFSGVLFKLTTLTKYINISIDTKMLISVDLYNKADNVFISTLGTYQCEDVLLNLNFNKKEQVIDLKLVDQLIVSINLNNIDAASQPRDNILNTGNWTDVALKSILVYNNVISDNELIYNYNYFKSREYKFINRLNNITELIPNSTKLLNQLSNIKELLAASVGVDGNKLIIINKSKDSKMYYGNTLTTNKNFIYAGPFNNTECFSVDTNPDPNMVEEIINLPTNVNRSDFTSYLKDCANLKYINLANLNTDSMTISKQMFMGCKGLWDLDVSYIKMNNVTNPSFMFKNSAIKNIVGFSNWVMSKCTTLESIFENAYIRNFNGYQNWDVSLNTILKSAFANFINSESIIDISNWNCNNVLDASMAFKGCRSNIILIHNAFSKCVNFSETFRDCINLISLPNVITNQIAGTDYSNMYNNCNKLTSVNIGILTSAILIPGIFKDCKSLTDINLTGNTFGNVTDASFAFSGCIGLKKLTGSNSMILNHCTNADGMFDDCHNLAILDLSGINTVSMINLPTFKNCHSLTTFTLSASYFNSQAVIYDFSGLTNWTDTNNINNVINVIPNTVIGKSLKLSNNTKAVITDAQRTILQTKGWTII